MGFIEDYFGKSEPTDIELKTFIDQGNKESLTLDYKQIEKFKDSDLLEHISAFANSAGGLIILGVEEKEDELPGNITWGNLREYQKEALESKIVSTIYPKISGIKIVTVSNSSDSDKRIFLIDIPQGDNPPYMAGDKRYYKRINFQKRRMEGYEVADCFGKRRRPKLRLVVNHFIPSIFDSGVVTLRWDVYVTNLGKAVTKEILCKIESHNTKFIGGSDDFKGFTDEMSHVSGAIGIFSDPHKHVLFPHPTMETFLGTVQFNTHVNDWGDSAKFNLSYELLAESMPITKGKFTISITVIGGKTFEPNVSEIHEEELHDW
jgi:Predicted transcriptional regulator containing an HTH domain and an uncharacterized domain shared with the mammalian protein Schlafen